MGHMSRDANLLGAAALAIAERLPPSAGDATLIALSTWLSGSTIDGLARVLHLTHSGAVRLADRLESEGLLERRPGADGRTRALHLTAPGRRVATALQAERFAALEELLDPLAADERATLTQLLEKLLAGLTTDHASAGRTCRLCAPDVCGHPDRCPVTLAAAG
jgi:MarR family transcriptional regulator, negative regulator of the multidrug operon emrRAB